MQADVSSIAPAESRAAQFAMDLVEDLVASDARSSVWDAQVALLTDFVQSGERQRASDPLNAPSGRVKDNRTRSASPRSAKRAPFVPMS
jgi:hypothetical protein